MALTAPPLWALAPWAPRPLGAPSFPRARRLAAVGREDGSLGPQPSPQPQAWKACQQNGVLVGRGVSAEPPAPQALTCGQGQAKGRPVKLVQEVHAVIAAGLQHVAVCVRQVRWQHGEQAGLGGQAPRVLRPQPGVPRGAPRLRGPPWGAPGSGLPRWPPLACVLRRGHGTQSLVLPAPLRVQRPLPPSLHWPCPPRRGAESGQGGQHLLCECLGGRTGPSPEVWSVHSPPSTCHIFER